MKVPEPEEIIMPHDVTFATLSQRLILENLAPEAAKNPLFKNEVPYDLFCPKVYHEITRRVCIECGVYFPSNAAMKRHASSLKGRHHQINVNDNENGISIAVTENIKNDTAADDTMPIYSDVTQYLVSPWTES